MKLAAFLLMAGLLGAQEKDRARPRGQSGPPDESQSWTRGRLGTQNPAPGKLTNLDGLLVDASCDDRSALNLNKRPDPAQLASVQSAERTAPAAKAPVDAHAEHPHDPATHQTDRSCAITGATRAFALLTKEGRLLNLSEGGNTLAMQALHANPDGRAMLNGTGGGIKPQVTVRGRVHGDRVIVEKIVKL